MSELCLAFAADFPEGIVEKFYGLTATLYHNYTPNYVSCQLLLFNLDVPRTVCGYMDFVGSRCESLG
jgi:hypothetical protein